MIVPLRFIALAAACLTSATASAQSVGDFFHDKTITIVSAGDAGGAHGAYLQLVAAHIRKFIPGAPAINLQYMVGAGGNLAMNYLQNVAPKDGTFLGVPLQDLIFNARIGVAAVKYDPRQAKYIGGADITRTIVTVMKSSGVLTIEDAKRREIVIGASGASGQNYTIPAALNALVSTKFRIVTGYPGINDIHLAMEQGEIQGTAASWGVIVGTRRDWVERDIIANLVTVAMEREPELPGTPALAELLASPDDLDLVPLLAGSAALGRAWVAFGDIPPERLSALRDAYAQTMVDPAFRADAEKRGLPLAPVGWRAQQDIVAKIMATPDIAVSRLQRILAPN